MCLDTPGRVAQGGGLLGNLREGEGPSRCARLSRSRAARGGQAGRLGSASALGPAPPLRVRVSPQGVRPVGGTGARGSLYREATSGVGLVLAQAHEDHPSSRCPGPRASLACCGSGGPSGWSLSAASSLPASRLPSPSPSPPHPGLLSSLHLPAQFSSVQSRLWVCSPNAKVSIFTPR